jgi:putative endonuclease
MTYWVYILASKPGGTIYIGVTNNLVRRIYEHREGLAESFTKRYGIKTLVYFEPHETIAAALQREKNIKHWSREWKIDLIVASNADWRDLYENIVRYRGRWIAGSSPATTASHDRLPHPPPDADALPQLSRGEP